MATYGLTTYKSDGTTVVLQNSTKSGVFGRAHTVTKTGTAGTQTVITFPEYTGRTIRPIQLKPGAHTWSVSVVSNVPRITFTENSEIGVTGAAFYYDSTTLYIFVK